MELESFFIKFKHLLHSGYNATLSLESVKGEAFVCLKAGLGPVNLPQTTGNCCLSTQHPTYVRHRSPSYKRRQERRRRSFQTKQETVDEVNSDRTVEETEKVSGLSSSKCDKDFLSANGTRVENDAQAEEVSDLIIDSAAADIEFACDICDFSSNWRNGLSFHISSSHEITNEKLKSSDEIINLTQSYWKTGKLVSNMQVYVNALMDIEKATNVNDDVKEEEEIKLEEIWNKIQKKS